MCIICSVWHIQMLVDFLKYIMLLTTPYKKEETAHKVVAYINPKMSVLVNE